MRDELKVFFTDHHFHLSDRLYDDEFLTRLAFLGDAFQDYRDSTTIFNVWDRIEVMIKLELFSVCINKDNIQVCPSLYDVLCANELKLTDNVKCDIAKHLSELGRNCNKRFCENAI